MIQIVPSHTFNSLQATDPSQHSSMAHLGPGRYIVRSKLTSLYSVLPDSSHFSLFSYPPFATRQPSRQNFFVPCHVFVSEAWYCHAYPVPSSLSFSRVSSPPGLDQRICTFCVHLSEGELSFHQTLDPLLGPQ